MNNTALVEKFYTSFSNGDAIGMRECYHQNILFKDPVFGTLKGERAAKMWEMLLSGKNSNLKISFDNIQTTPDNGTATWVATYTFGKKKRNVVNTVHATFKFKDGKIIEHTDDFNLWKWTQQTMGFVGYLLGWTPFMKNKIQTKVKKQLDKYISNKHS